MLKKLAFFIALITMFSGGAAAVVGTTDAMPIRAAAHSHRFDRDK